MALVFEATAADGSPRRFAGMYRPSFEDYAGRGYVHCSCGMICQTFGQVREHWQLGHFDAPLYEDQPDPVSS